jgi:hypothetical protein
MTKGRVGEPELAEVAPEVPRIGLAEDLRGLTSGKPARCAAPGCVACPCLASESVIVGVLSRSRVGFRVGSAGRLPPIGGQTNPGRPGDPEGPCACDLAGSDLVGARLDPGSAPEVGTRRVDTRRSGSPAGSTRVGPRVQARTLGGGLRVVDPEFDPTRRFPGRQKAALGPLGSPNRPGACDFRIRSTRSRFPSGCLSSVTFD